MKEIVFDWEDITTTDNAHSYIKEKLDLPRYYGKNLDALWDVLSTYNERVEIKFINTDFLLDCLGGYGNSIIKVFEDANNENENIIFSYKKEQRDDC